MKSLCHTVLSRARRLALPLCLALAVSGAVGCASRGASVEIGDRVQKGKETEINNTRLIRIDIILRPEKPSAFSTTDPKVEDAWFNTLCANKSWDEGNRALWASLQVKPNEFEDGKANYKLVSPGGNKIMDGELKGDEAEQYKYAAVFWWYHGSDKRGFHENTELVLPFRVLLEKDEAKVEWRPPSFWSNLIGRLEDLSTDRGA